MKAHGELERLGENDRDTKQMILQQAKEQLLQQFSAENYRFDIKARWIPRRLLEVGVQGILGVQLDGNVRRYTNFEVLYRDHQKKRRVQIQLVVELEKKVPVVIRRIRSGSEIKKEDLKNQWVSLSRNKDNLIEDVDTLIGKTLRRTLLTGQPVQKSFISREFIVEAGDQVQVLIRKKGIQVQVAGEARENGAKGDKIRIYSDETRRKYVGEVVRSGLILWKNTL
ncbi:flagellar basal body P-ring formation chaperone FlgA [Fodinibius saliphilus]|uniref:flagellar basal body P-ring formation chaperone FlgA n=1 Tax=Fodinibius saliphilus TaxID=1920650 RepID=UPI001109C9BA|nr:flagellar basal body P-ring formation chaperone FlgA [Fodinibius saliphilus]